MNPADRIARSGRLIFAEVDEETVALDVASGACFGLNKVASRIWRLIEAPTTVAEIIAALLVEYDVEPETCRTEVNALLDQMLGEDLIAVAPAAGGRRIRPK